MDIRQATATEKIVDDFDGLDRQLRTETAFGIPVIREELKVQIQKHMDQSPSESDEFCDGENSDKQNRLRAAARKARRRNDRFLGC